MGPTVINSVVLIPLLRLTFRLTMLDGGQWLLAAGLLAFMLVYVEVEKAVLVVVRKGRR